VGAFLGLAVANPQRRVIGLIGDGSFQMTAQEVSTILRYMGCRATSDPALLAAYKRNC